MKTCDRCGAKIETGSSACPSCGQLVLSISASHGPASSPPDILSDASKGISLLYGILAIYLVYSVAIALKMTLTRTPAGLIELLIFAYLAADTLVLLAALRWPRTAEHGLLHYLGVWILGLIPYFIWAVIYAVGRWISSLIEPKRGNLTVIALILWLGILFLCSAVQFTMSRSVAASI
jgi:hypothetical protein